jgi:hypothetical protein
MLESGAAGPDAAPEGAAADPEAGVDAPAAGLPPNENEILPLMVME